jgi:DNA-binding transcriptional LysR family regulator
LILQDINFCNFVGGAAVELKWLEDLLVLPEERSISRAAERRRVPRPACSRPVRQPEQWLGGELVDRAARPVRARGAGLALKEGVRDLVNRFHALRNRLHESSERASFVARYTLAIARFPALIGGVIAAATQRS